MRVRTIVFLAASLLAIAPVTAAQPLQDFKGYKDPALFTRMPNHVLAGRNAVQERQYDAHEFNVMEGKTRRRERVEGHYIEYFYTFDTSAGAALPSYLQILRNYQAAAAKIGGENLYEDGTWATIRVKKDGRETWVEVARRNGGYGLLIVERQSMAQEVTANAQAFQSGLATSGHVEVPGILFDFGKSDVKPESEAALQEVAKLLKANPTLKVWVVGHTDNVGSAEINVKLSGDRAAAVVKVLCEKMGADPKRLSAHGAGPFAPVATNTTEEGRAKNRRVELVAQS